MGRKRITVGQSEWAIPDGSAENVIKQITEAMQGGSVAELSLLDRAGRPVTVLLNGQATPTVAVGEDTGTRPSEISG